MSNEMLKNKIAVVAGFQKDIADEIANLFELHGAKVFKYVQNADFKNSNTLTENADVFVFIPPLFEFSEFACHDEKTLNKPVCESISLLTELMQKYIKGMKANKSGKIVNVIYDYTDNAVPEVCAHALYSGAVKSLTKAIAMDYCKYDIRANCIMAGFNIGMQGKYWKESLKKDSEFIDYQPIKRLGLPSDIANAALFLASDMSSFISGESIPVNGGAFAIGHNQAWNDWLKRI